VFVSATVNLETIKPTKILEEYGLPFSFDIPNANVKSEILGGFIEQDKDRLPGIVHDGISLRRSASIFNDKENIIWSTADARIIRIRKDETTNNQVIISNLVTNFPNDWNRHEDLTGKVDFRYAFTSGNGSFDPAKTSMLGYGLNSPLQLRKSWFRPSPSNEEYFAIDNPNVILLNLKSVEHGYIIRLINADSQNSQTAKIKSKLLTNQQAEMVDLLGSSNQTIEINDGSFEVALKAGEFIDILINTFHN
jgi:alpha-mannosidase